MRRISTLWRSAGVLVGTLAAWAALAGAAWAQTTGGDSTEAPAPVAPYAIVGFGVLLALFIVMAPSKRRDRAKQDQFAEKKKTVKH